MPKKVLLGFGIDVDAVAGWIDTQDGSKCDSVKISRGVFGATVGIERLLDLLDKHNIKATWFVPAHTCETFPKQVARIRDSGHEIGLHGYTHEYVSSLSRTQEADVLRKSLDVMAEFLGFKPRGWTAPGFTCSHSTVEILEQAGLEYDHSYIKKIQIRFLSFLIWLLGQCSPTWGQTSRLREMHHDCLLYYTPYSNYNGQMTDYAQPAETWMRPTVNPKISSIVTVPANWHLDDWPAFSPGDGGSDGFIDPDAVLRMWKTHFLYYRQRHDESVLPISLHPQISGKPHVLNMIEKFIVWVSAYEGVEWCTFGGMVDHFKMHDFARWRGLEQGDKWLGGRR